MGKDRAPKKQPDPATLINARTPLFAPPAVEPISMPSRSADLAPWVPSPFEHDSREALTPRKLGAKPGVMQTSAASNVDHEPGMTRNWYRDSTGVSGTKGSIRSQTAIGLTRYGEPPVGLVAPQELNLPPREVSLYPVQISYRREIDYLDRKGQAIHVEVVVSLGMEHATFERQAGGIWLREPDFQDLSGLSAESATAHIFVSGTSPESTGYFATTIVKGADTSLAAMLPRLELEIPGAKNPLVYQSVPAFIQPRAAAWEQFEAIGDMVKSFDAAHREQAEVDAAEERLRKKKSYNTLERAGLAALGAMVSIGEGFKESVLAIADLGRLIAALPGYWTGLYDYDPTMWSQAGKAADNGATSGDIARGMVKGIVETPERWAEAAKNDDPYQFGKESMNLYMLGRSGVSAARGTASLAFNAGVRGLSKFGIRGFKATVKIRNWQLRRSVPSSTSGMVFPKGRNPTYEYDPVLHITEPGVIGKFKPEFNSVIVSESAFLPSWRGMVPKLPAGSLRMRVGNFLRGNMLGRAVRHETQHAYQLVFDPMNPAWHTSVPYFSNTLEFAQAGSKLPGAWNAQLGAPAGSFSRAIGGMVQAPAQIDARPEPAVAAYLPTPTDEENRVVMSVIQRATMIETVKELEAKVGDKPLLVVVDGNGRILVGPDTIRNGVWFVYGDETSQYVVPSFVLDQVDVK